jgi:16S rRNA (adenine1518-N6/adenine1519-N6)-dimethyltransferase
MKRQAMTSRGLGQNFLVDRHAVTRIVNALSPGPDDLVLEIGPGRGVLTEPLVSRAGRIVAVELDGRLADGLRQRFAESRLVLVRQDVLAVDLRTIGPRLGGKTGARLTVAGNLPYGISKPIAMKLIRERGSIDRAVLMFQQEVADRLVAAPGSRSYGPLTVLARLTYSIRRLFDLPPAAFRPRPKIVSTITDWRPLAETVLDDGLEPALRTCLAAAFRSRRRTLRNNLLAALEGAEQVDDLLSAAALDGQARAEAIPPDGFVRLAREWPRSL